MQKLSVSFMVSATCRIFGALSVFLLSVVIGRTLGADDAGLYFLSFSIVTFLSAFSRMGFDNTLIRFVGASFVDNDWSDIKYVVFRSMLCVSVVSTFVAFFLYFGSNFVAINIFDKPSLASVLQSFAPGVIGLSLFTLISMALQGIHRVAYSVFIINILVNVFVILLIYTYSLSSPVVFGLFWSISSFLTFLTGS